MQLIRLMSTNPAELLGVPGGTLAIGEWADITLIDPQEEWTFTEADIRSKSRNTPFWGQPSPERSNSPCLAAGSHIEAKRRRI